VRISAAGGDLTGSAAEHSKGEKQRTSPFNNFQERIMANLKTALAIAAGAVIISGGSVIAQTKIDMAKITCADLVNSYAEDVVVIGTWMSGYYNAKRNNTTIDPKTLAANSKRVADYCRANPKVTVMKAIESL
jgi:hypothetical protein